MVKRYSIAEARDNFTGIVHEAESGDTVEVTRRGKPVAVLVARGEYERLTQGRRGFREAYREFLERYPPSEENTLEPEEWLERDRNPSPLLGDLDRRALRRPQGPNSGLNAVLGRWPGDESEEEIAAALDELS